MPITGYFPMGDFLDCTVDCVVECFGFVGTRHFLVDRENVEVAVRESYG